MNWNEECRKLHRAGVEERGKMPYANTGIPFRIIPYYETERHPRILELKNGVNDEARFLIRTQLVKIFAATHLYAAILQSDSRIVEMHAFAARFELSQEMGPERIQREYSRILGEQFGGLMENLPRDLWRDAIFTAVKGPTIAPLLISSVYHKGENGEVVWDESDETTTAVSSILPDWWESTIQ